MDGTLLAHFARLATNKGGDLQPMEGLAADRRFFAGMAQWFWRSVRQQLRTVAITDLRMNTGLRCKSLSV
jgi:hypothetical protein